MARTLEPRTVEEAAAALAAAARDGKRVRPQGGGTFQFLGGKAPAADLTLRTTALTRTVFYEPEELVVKVEAGQTVAALLSRLAAKGQEVPWDEPWPERRTVGGVVAAGLAGPRRLAWGAPRDHVLGVTLLLPDGATARPGGRVVKNVAGYDLTRLAVGSRGALGVIAEVTMKTKPLPERSWALTARYPSPAELFAGAFAVLDAGAFPSFVEAHGGPDGFTLAAGCEGPAEQVAAQREAVLAAADRGRDPAEHEGPAVRKLLGALAGAPWEARGTVLRVSVPRRALADILPGANAPFFSSAGSGTARLALADAGDADGAREALDRWHALAAARGGWAEQERGPLPRAESAPSTEGVRKLNDAVRRAFDPAGCLA